MAAPHRRQDPGHRPWFANSGKDLSRDFSSCSATADDAFKAQVFANAAFRIRRYRVAADAGRVVTGVAALISVLLTGANRISGRNAEPSHDGIQGSPGHAEAGRRLGYHPTRFLQHPNDVIFLHLFQGAVARLYRAM